VRAALLGAERRSSAVVRARRCGCLGRRFAIRRSAPCAVARARAFALLAVQAGAKCVKERHRAVAPVEVALGERLILARAVVAQRVEPRGAALILLGEPDLIPPEEAGVEQRHVVGVHNELGTVRVGLGTVEQCDEAAHQERVETAVNLVDGKDVAALERADDGPGDREEPPGAERLVVAGKVGRPLREIGGAVAHRDLDALEVHGRQAAPQLLGDDRRLGVFVDMDLAGREVHDPDIRLCKQVAYLLMKRGVVRNAPRGLSLEIRMGRGTEYGELCRKPPEDLPQLLVAEGGRGGQERHVRARDLRQALLLAHQAWAEVPIIQIAVAGLRAAVILKIVKQSSLAALAGGCAGVRAQLALEPGLGLALGKGDEPLLVEAHSVDDEAVLVANAVVQKRQLALGRRLALLRVKHKRLQQGIVQRAPTAGGRAVHRSEHQQLDEGQREDHVAFPRGVGAVDHSTPRQPLLEAWRANGVGLQQRFISRGDHAQPLLISERTKVLHAKFDEHAPTLSGGSNSAPSHSMLNSTENLQKCL